MGAINGTDMVAQIRVITGVQDTNLLSAAQALEHVNAAYINDVCSKHPLPELDKSTTQTLTAASTSSTATDILFIKGITNASGVPLREISDDEWVRLGMIVAAAGTTPTHWHRASATISGQVTLAVYPTPTSATVSINYQSRPSAMTSGATVIDAMYDQPIIYYAASRCTAFLRMYDDSIKLRQFAESLMESIFGDKTSGIKRGSKSSKSYGRVLQADGGE
jgi:hypothetical protein